MTLDQRPGTGRSDLRAKGLSSNSVGLLACVVLGVSSIAPVYALTPTLGPTVAEVGLQMPAIFLAGFLPMLLVAYAYRELNRVAPDCGTSDRKSTRLNSSHANISYAVFCLKKNGRRRRGGTRALSSEAATTSSAT